MRWTSLVALSGTAALLSSLVYLDLQQGPGAANESRQAILSGLTQQRVYSLRVVRPAQPMQMLMRRGVAGEWRMVAPQQGLVDGEMMQRLLSTLELDQPLRQLAPPSHADRWGLNPPRLRLYIEQEGVATHVVELGADDASGGGVYARVAGRYMVLSHELAELIELDRERILQRALLPFAAAEVAAIRVSQAAASAPVGMRRDAMGRWWAGDGRQRKRLSTLRVARLMANLAAARWQRFSDVTQLAAQSSLVLQASGPRLQLDLAGECSAAARELQLVRWRWEGMTQLGCLQREHVQSWLQQLTELAERELTALREPQLRAVKIEGPTAQQLVFTREGATWRCQEQPHPLGRCAKVMALAATSLGDMLRQWVEALAMQQLGEEAPAASYEAPTAAAAGIPTTTLVIHLEPEQGAAEILRYRRQGPIAIVHRDGEGPSFLLSAAAAAVFEGMLGSGGALFKPMAGVNQ